MNRLISNNEKAFTLTELLIVLTIIGILAAIASPRFSNIIMRHKVVNTTNEISALLNYARAAAIKQNTATKVCVYFGTTCDAYTAGNVVAANRKLAVVSVSNTPKLLKVMDLPAGLDITLKLKIDAADTSDGTTQTTNANHILYNKNGSRFSLGSTNNLRTFNSSGTYTGASETIDSTAFYPAHICIKPTNPPTDFINMGMLRNIRVGELGEATVTGTGCL